jgi:hypothetical protein
LRREGELGDNAQPRNKNGIEVKRMKRGLRTCKLSKALQTAKPWMFKNHEKNI